VKKALSGVMAIAVLLLAAVGFATFWVAPAGLIASAAAQPAAEPAPIFFGTQERDAETLAMIAALRQKALIRGVVPVIAGLRMAVRPEHRLAPDQAALQARQLLGMQQAVARRVLGRSAGDGIVAFPYIPYLGLFVDPIQLDRLLDDPDVVSVEEDVPYRFSDKESNALIHAPDVWALGDTGQGQTIAILDTGVAACAPGPAGCPIVEHPALQGRVVAEACYSATSAKLGVASFCPGGAEASILYYSGVNCPYPAIENCGHGTGVASIAAADGGGVLMGVAHGAKIISIQVASEGVSKAVCGDSPVPCAISAQMNITSGLMHVYALHNQFRIAAVNLSVGGPAYPGTCDGKTKLLRNMAAAVDLLRSAGIAVSAAAGNDDASGKIALPACLSGATAVAWSDENTSTYLEAIDPGSDYSPLVKLAAPGTNILAAVPGGGYDPNFTGTSAAAPHAAGAFALLKAAKPDAGVADMEAALACTGKPVGRPADGRFLYKPRIDLIGAYDYLQHPGAFTRSWDFSNPQQAFDWLPDGGQWLVHNGQFVVTPTVVGPTGGGVGVVTADPNNALPIGDSSKSTCLGDSFTVEARMTRIYPDDPNASIFPGTDILFKYSVFDGTGYDFGYFYQTDTKPPLLPGLVSVFRCDGLGPCTELCEQQATTDTPFTVYLTAPNTLKVIASGSAFQFYINGARVCQGMKPDPTYVTGAIGINTTFLQTAGNSFSISNVAVKSPAPAALRVEANDTIDPADRFPAVHSTPGIAVEATPSGVVYLRR
jgi:subtilisin family serine protease